MKEEMRKTTKSSKVRAIFGWIGFLSVALFLIFFIVSHTLFPAFAMSLFGFRTMLIANTGSMEPYMSYNDLVIVRRTSIEEIEVGDVITFYASFRVSGELAQLPVTHQVIEIITGENGEIAFRTSGTADGITPDRILVTIDGIRGSNVFIGRVNHQSRILGNIIAYLTSLPGILAILINLTCLILIFVIIRKKSDKEKANDSEEFNFEKLQESMKYWAQKSNLE